MDENLRFIGLFCVYSIVIAVVASAFVVVVLTILYSGRCPSCKRFFAGKKLSRKKKDLRYYIIKYECKYCGERWEKQDEPFSDW